MPRHDTGQRLCLGVLLVGTGVLYLWNITVNGMGNQYYAASAQAGATNWEALLFGSLDSHNFITVDKPPLSQWVMGLSGQLFGFGSASMLVPQALMAVGAVALLYGAVRRICGPRAGLLAGAALAVTPVAVLMFRFNDPDAAMVLLMTAAAYCTVRAVQRGSARWFALAGVALGFAFLAKMLEGVMVMPALAAAYLVAAPVRPRVRLAHLLGAAAAFVLSAGWFVLLTVLWPTSARPYLAGSTDNDFMNLVLGYNGLARVLGHDHAGTTPPSLGAFAAQLAGGPSGIVSFGGFGSRSQTWSRLLFGEFGFEIGWLVPAAVLALAWTFVARGRAPRTDVVRAGAILFGGWFLVDGLVLSYMHGTIHPYYSLSIAPPVAAIYAIGLQQAWSRREALRCRAALVATLLAAGVWGWWLLGTSAMAWPALRWSVLAVSVLASSALLWSRVTTQLRRVGPIVLALAVAAGLSGPAAYALATVGSVHQGIGPSVGPARAGYAAGGTRLGNPRLDALLAATTTPWSAAIDRSSAAAGLELSTGTAVMAIGGFSGTDPVPTLPQFQDYVARHRVAYYLAPSGSSKGAAAQDEHGEDVSPRAHSDILRWVRGHFHSTTIGGVTAYDLAAPK